MSPPSEVSAALPAHLARRVLHGRATLEGERKRVTVLFADLVGSTRLASELDPEDMVELLNAVFSRWVDAVHAYEGTVDKFLGDGMLALFGAPLIHEDDPRRAVLAGLQIVEETAALAEESIRDGGPSLSVRVGLNTGTVVVGGVGPDARMEYTAIGDVVNVAQRVQAAAPPGSVYITDATRREVAPYFDVAAVGPVELKGVAEALPLFAVVADRGILRTVRGVEGLSSPLTGRNEEVSALYRAVERLDRGTGGSLALVAEAGLGKSRLVDEVTERARQGGLSTAAGHATSYGSTVPYLPVVELVRAVGPDLSDVTVRSLLGFDAATEDELRHRRTVQAVSRLVAERAPAVVVVEDLHWADQATLDIVAGLADIAAPAGFLLVVTTRPESPAMEFLERLPDVEVLTFGPLARSDGEDLLGAMLGPTALPRELAGQLLETSGGNPFYLEELVRSLIEQGRLTRTEAGEWQAAPGGIVSLPPTLEGLLGSRIDRLPPEPKRLLRSAAVLGRDVSTRLLDAVEPDLCHHLPVLVEAGFLVPVDGGHRFNHVLTQEAAYGALLKRRRREVHRRAAEAIESLHAGDLESWASELGRHYDEAGDHDQARHHLSIAGRRAAAGYANDAAVSLLTRALELTTEPDSRLELLGSRAEVSSRIGDHEAERADVEEMAALADISGLRRHRLGVLIARARHLMSVDHAAAPRIVEEAVALADALGHHRDRGRLLYMLGTLAVGEYSPERAVPLFEEAAAAFGAEGLLTDRANALVALIQPVAAVAPDRLGAITAEASAAAEAAGDPAVEASLRLQLAALALEAGDPAEADDHLQIASSHAGDAGDRRIEMRILLRRRYVASTLGDEQGADEFSIRTMELAERYREWLLWLYGAMGYVEGLEARERFLTLHRWLIDLIGEIGPHLPAHPLSYLHYALGYRTARWFGLFDEALEHLATARRLADRDASAPPMVMYRNGIAACLLERGDLPEARQAIDEAAVLMAEHRTGAVTGAYVDITNIRIALAEGDPARARRLLDGLEPWTTPAEAVGERQAAALLSAEVDLLEGRPDRAVAAAAAAVDLDRAVRRGTRWFTLLQCLDVKARALEACARRADADGSWSAARTEAERSLARLAGTRFTRPYRARPEVRRALGG